MRYLPIMQHHHIAESLSAWADGFGKSTDKLSENPSPYGPKASCAIFEEI